MADNTINPGSGLQGDARSNSDFISAEELGIDVSNVGPLADGYAMPASPDPVEDTDNDLIDLGLTLDSKKITDLTPDAAISNEEQYLVEDYAEKLGADGVYGINTGMMQAMAERQSAGEQFLRLGARIAQVPFNLVGSAANMLDIEDYFNSDGEMGNWVSEMMTEISEDIAKSNGIYRKNPGKAFDVTDSGWWMENGSGLVNSMLEFVTLGAITGGVGGGARFLAGLKKLSDGTKGARAFDALASSFLLNQAESMKGAAEIYKSTREKAVASGMSGREADQVAADAAAYAVNIQRANIAVNMTSAGRFLKPAKATRGAINEAATSNLKKFGKDVLVEAPQEYIEENINLIGENEGNRLGEALLADKKYEYNFENTLGDVGSLEGLEAGVLGMAGAIGQTAGTSAVNAVPYKKRTKTDADGNIVYKEKGNLAYIKQDNIDAVNNLYKSKTAESVPEQEYKATPLRKNGEDLGWIVDDNGKKVTVNKDDEAGKAKYGIEQPEGASGMAAITKEDLAQATGLAEGDARLDRIMKMHEKVVEKGLTSLNDPKLRAEGKEFDVAEKKEVKEWYSLNAESKEKKAKLEADFAKLNDEMTKQGISTSDVMMSAKEQIAHQNELNLIDVLSDPTVFKSTAKRQAVLEKMKTYADKLDGKAKTDYLNNIAKLDKATVEELEEYKETAKNRLLASQVKSHAAIGAVEKLEELYQRVANMSPEKAAEQGYDEDYKASANAALKQIKDYEKVYQKVAGRFGKDVDNILFESAVRTQELEKEIKSLSRKKELADARRKLTGEKVKTKTKGKTSEQIDKEIEKQKNLIEEYKVRQKTLGKDAKVDYDAKIKEAEKEIKDLGAEEVVEDTTTEQSKLNIVYGEASVEMSDYEDITNRLDKAEKKFKEEIQLQQDIKTPAGQAKYFSEKSAPQRAFERKRLVHNKLVEMYQEQLKEGDDQAVYFYKDKPVMLVPKEDKDSDFGYTFDLVDAQTEEVIRAVDEGGLKTLLENSKSQAEYLKYIEDVRVAEITKQKNEILKQVRKQGTEQIIDVQKQQAKTKHQITELETAIKTLTASTVTEKLSLDTKFKDGSVRTDNYKFNAADNSITNLKTGKKLFGQSPLRSRLEKQFQEEFEVARESIVTNNAVIEQMEEQLDKYEAVYNTLSQQKNLIRDYQDLLNNKEEFLLGSDVEFQKVFENAIEDLRSSVGTSVEDLARQANQLEGTQSDLVQSIGQIQSILDNAKIEDLNILERNSLEVRLAKQQRLLRSLDRKVESMNEALKDYAENEETVNLMKHINDMLLLADAAARKAAEKTKKEMGNANFPAKGSNPEPVTVDDVDFKKGNLARKISAYTTAGNDLGDPSETSKRWYRALNMIGPKQVKNYRLEMMTREQAEARIAEDPAYATIFSEENKDYELYEYENGKPVLDAAGAKILRETPYVGLRAVLINKDGSLAKSDTAGKITNSGTLALSGYIHNPDGKTVVYQDEEGNLQSSLSVPHIIRESENFKMDKDGMPYALSTIQGWLGSQGPVTVKGVEYDNGVDFQNKVLKDVYEDLQKFRNNIMTTIDDNDRAIVKIEELSGGHPIKEPRNFEGNRIEKNPGKTFANVKSIERMEVTPRGEVTVEDNKGRRLDLVPRLINDVETNAVLQILNGTLNSEDMRTKGTPAPIGIENQKYNAYPFASDKMYSIIEQYIYWGKAQDGKNADYQIFFDKDTQRLHFGAEDSIPFNEIMTSEDLKKFLSSKRLNFNKTINKKVKSAGKDKSPFVRVEFDATGGAKAKTYNGEGKLSGYENFIYQNYTTDLVDSTEDRPNFAQRSISFSKNLTSVDDVSDTSSDDSVIPQESNTGGASLQQSSQAAAKDVFGAKTKTTETVEEVQEEVQDDNTPSYENNADGFLSLLGDDTPTETTTTKSSTSGTFSTDPSVKLPAANVKYVHNSETTKSNEKALKKAFERIAGVFKDNGVETNYKTFDQFAVANTAVLDEWFANARDALAADVADAIKAGGKADIEILANSGEQDKLFEKYLYKLSPVQIVKLHNFIGENARLFKAKGLSLNPAVYEVEMKSTTNNVDTFIDVMKNYLNC